MYSVNVNKNQDIYIKTCGLKFKILKRKVDYWILQVKNKTCNILQVVLN